jgi:hypothetical protein
MLSGPDLVQMTRDRRIADLEGHLTALYGLRATELAALTEAALGAGLASLGAIALTALQQPAPGTSNAPFVALLLFGAIYSLAAFALKWRIAELRPELTAAKDIAGMLTRIYR